MRPFSSASLLLALSVLWNGCGASPSSTFIAFSGFTEHGGEPLVVRIVEGADEKLGTRQVAPLGVDGSQRFEFSLVAETRYRLQYFTDSNANGQWDGPVDSGEHSWDRALSLPRPLHNYDAIEVSIGHDRLHAPLPADFRAP